MRYDAQIGSYDLHVDPMFLFADDHGPPQAAVDTSPVYAFSISVAVSRRCFG